MKRHYKNIIITILATLVCCLGKAYAGPELMYPELVSKFYTALHHRLFWVDGAPHATELRAFLLQKIDSAASIGSDRKQYNYSQLAAIDETVATLTEDSAALWNMDILFTDAAIAYCKSLYQGTGISEGIKYDEWSKKYTAADNDYVVTHLAGVRSALELSAFINLLTPHSTAYYTYITELELQTANSDPAKTKQVAVTMNFYRWMHHFHFEKFIVVNVAAAGLRYYEHDSEVLYSKMIVGKPSKRTPRFDATCRQIILYPYWNVPTDIAAKELLPKYKRSPALIDKQNMQVVDAKGNVVSPRTINWAAYSTGNFPFRLRQSTGCDNSLGIIKFDLTSPFSVYLHDTNEKELFNANYRYRSHGCMRVEKAIELGNYLLNNKLDTTYLQACIKGEKPVPLQLKQPVPVFVVYLTADENNNVITYYKDVYHLNINH